MSPFDYDHSFRADEEADRDPEDNAPIFDSEYVDRFILKNGVSPYAILDILAKIYSYNDDADVAVAHICDDDLDRSGRLLGEVRDRADAMRRRRR